MSANHAPSLDELTGKSTTDKDAGWKTGPPTSQDGARAGDVLDLRRLLLQDGRVQDRLDRMFDVRPTGHASGWGAHAGLKYYLDLERLWRDLDYAWTQSELDHIVARWAAPGPLGSYRDQVAAGVATVGVDWRQGAQDAPGI